MCIRDSRLSDYADDRSGLSAYAKPDGADQSISQLVESGSLGVGPVTPAEPDLVGTAVPSGA
eukprot:13381448-Alexandrium_andersonii.AAC.1